MLPAALGLVARTATVLTARQGVGRLLLSAGMASPRSIPQAVALATAVIQLIEATHGEEGLKKWTEAVSNRALDSPYEFDEYEFFLGKLIKGVGKVVGGIAGGIGKVAAPIIGGLTGGPLGALTGILSSIPSPGAEEPPAVGEPVVMSREVNSIIQEAVTALENARAAEKAAIEAERLTSERLARWQQSYANCAEVRDNLKEKYTALSEFTKVNAYLPRAQLEWLYKLLKVAPVQTAIREWLRTSPEARAVLDEASGLTEILPLSKCYDRACDCGQCQHDGRQLHHIRDPKKRTLLSEGSKMVFYIEPSIGRNIHGYVDMATMPYPVVIAGDQPHGRAMISAGHEAAHVMNKLLKLNHDHNTVHNIGMFIASDVFPALRRLDEMKHTWAHRERAVLRG